MAENIPSSELGEYKGLYCLIGGKVSSYKDPDSFSVSLYFNNPKTKENIEIARIDNAHNEIHIHRFYRKSNQKEQIDIKNWEEAIEYLEKNWRKYTKRYYKNHLKK